MKQALLITICFLILQPLTAQKSINCLFEDMKDDDRSFALKLPGWIINTGLKLALADEDQDALMLLKDKIKQVRILVNEHPTLDLKKVINNFKSRTAKDNLELYTSIRHDSKHINVYVEEKLNKIKQLFFLISGEDGVVLLHIKTDFSLEDFQKAKFSFHNKK